MAARDMVRRYAGRVRQWLSERFGRAPASPRPGAPPVGVAPLTRVAKSPAKKKRYRSQKRAAGKGVSLWWMGRARNRRRQERRKLELDYLDVTGRPLSGRQWKRLLRAEKRAAKGGT